MVVVLNHRLGDSQSLNYNIIDTFFNLVNSFFAFFTFDAVKDTLEISLVAHICVVFVLVLLKLYMILIDEIDQFCVESLRHMDELFTNCLPPFIITADSIFVLG